MSTHSLIGAETNHKFQTRVQGLASCYFVRTYGNFFSISQFFNNGLMIVYNHDLST